jgi:hypothetical protein
LKMDRGISDRLLRIIALAAAVKGCAPGNSVLADTAKLGAAIDLFADMIGEEAEAAFDQFEQVSAKAAGG